MVIFTKQKFPPSAVESKDISLEAIAKLGKSGILRDF
jgi:hypothetical protein